jgi:hypothetical protein
MAGYAKHLFQQQQDTQRIIVEQLCRLVGYAKEVKNLTQEINCMARENGVVRQQVREESRLRNKEEALLSSFHRSFEHD